MRFKLATHSNSKLPNMSIATGATALLYSTFVPDQYLIRLSPSKPQVSESCVS